MKDKNPNLNNKNDNQNPEKRILKPQPLEQGDYYMNENGLLVFTAQYHLKRGFCCGSKCKHCPYNWENVK